MAHAEFDDFDVGDNQTLIQALQTEIVAEDGFDCASVEVLIRMAR